MPIWFDMAAESDLAVRAGNTAKALSGIGAHLAHRPPSPCHLAGSAEFSVSPEEVAGFMAAFVGDARGIEARYLARPGRHGRDRIWHLLRQYRPEAVSGEGPGNLQPVAVMG
jgi:hypothetical protein